MTAAMAHTEPRPTEKAQTVAPAGDRAHVRVAHAVPGRVRLKFAALKGNPALARELEARLRDVAGVRSVDANPTTGSALILYDERHGSWADRVESLASTVAPIVPELGTSELARRLRERPTADATGIAIDGQSVHALFQSANEAVVAATGGPDLNVLVPVALAALGIGGFLAAENVTLPHWYEFFWFAFGTFIALNAVGLPTSEAVEIAAEVATV